MTEIFLAFISKQLTSGNLAVAILAALVSGALYSVTKADAVFDFFRRIHSRKQDELISYAKHEQLPEHVRTRAAQEFSRMTYAKITGIHGDHHFITKIDTLIQNSHGEIQLLDIRRARQFLKLIGGEIVVKVTRTDQAERVFILCASLFSLAVSVLTFATGMLMDIPIHQHAIFISVAVGTYLAALLMLREAQPVRIARKLEPLLERLQRGQSCRRSAGGNMRRLRSR